MGVQHFSKLKRAVPLILLLLCFLSVNGNAWDEIGHKVTAYIAWETMTPAARSEAVRLLLAAPEDSDLNVLYNAFSSRSQNARGRELLEYASTWPDVIRNRDFEVRYARYHHGNWHYAGVFWKGDGEVIPDFPQAGGLAVDKLYEFEKTLRDRSLKDAERSIALAWFLHVGGDIHNPLHNASRVTDLEPEGDRGGNLFSLEPQKPDGSRRLNLHGYWDSIIGMVMPRKRDNCDDRYIGRIAKKTQRMNPLSRFESRLLPGDYRAWSNEGFRLLPKTVYAGVQREQLPPRRYRKNAFRTARARIALAGYRLGIMLNRILDPKTNADGSVS